MSTTRIFVTPDQAKASQTEGFWRNTHGYHVAVAGPTDGCEVDAVDDGVMLWQPTGPGPFYIVIATLDPLQLAAAPVG